MSDNSEGKIGFEFTVTYRLVVNLESDSGEIVIPALTLKKHDLAQLLAEKNAHNEVKQAAKRWRNWFSKFKKDYTSVDSVRSFIQSVGYGSNYRKLPRIRSAITSLR